MDSPVLTIKEVFLTGEEPDRRARLQELADAWLRIVAGQTRP